MPLRFAAAGNIINGQLWLEDSPLAEPSFIGNWVCNSSYPSSGLPLQTPDLHYNLKPLPTVSIILPFAFPGIPPRSPAYLILYEFLFLKEPKCTYSWALSSKYVFLDFPKFSSKNESFFCSLLYRPGQIQTEARATCILSYVLTAPILKYIWDPTTSQGDVDEDAILTHTDCCLLISLVLH